MDNVHSRKKRGKSVILVNKNSIIKAVKRELGQQNRILFNRKGIVFSNEKHVIFTYDK